MASFCQALVTTYKTYHHDTHIVLGKTTEYLVLSRLLKEQREAYLPAVDDHGVDVIVRTRHKGEDEGLSAVASYEFASEEERAACLAEEFQEIQIKSAASNGLFAAMKITPAPNYWFVFYVQSHDTMWLINSMDVVRLGCQNSPTCKNPGLYSLSLATSKKIRPLLARYVVADFSKLP